MISRYLNMVQEFNRAIQAPRGWEAKGLRGKLIVEEAGELLHALHAKDPIALIDGICDLLYVLYGAADTFDLPLGRIAEEDLQPRIPALSFEEIQENAKDFQSTIAGVLADIQMQNIGMLLAGLRDAIGGCWLIASEGLGLALGPFFEEVHRTNMLKVTGPVRADGKKLKPEGWIGPRIEDMYAKRKGMPCPEGTP
jgi:NTP pyrophosphatase (non-canonical NTP hydrolase)